MDYSLIFNGGKHVICLDGDKFDGKWCVYILLCGSDLSLYTGITNNIRSRFMRHSSGKGAKYTRGRGPFLLYGCKFVGSKSEALKLEYRVKRQSKDNKLKYLNSYEEKNI